MCPLVQPDFTDAMEMTVLPPGVHKVRVVGAEAKTSQAGNQYINWKLETFGADASQLNNRVVFHSTPTTGKGSGILRSFLLAAKGELPNGSFDTDSVLGSELQVTTIEETDRQTGEKTGYARVKAVAPLKA